jgi:hypothetical protein
MTQEATEINLRLAAEDFEPGDFEKYHKFSSNDERVISKLIAHGPVLLQGGRGSGKSALMIEAKQRLGINDDTAPAFGIYLSLRHMPLLRSAGIEYERIFCELLIDALRREVSQSHYEFSADPDLRSLQYGIANLSQQIGKRIVLLFDDAAHIGREASLADFFDIFRTLSSSTVSCKATIYPGVKNFGTRFDVYNDATVVDVIRDEDQTGFAALFVEILQARFPQLLLRPLSPDLTLETFARFLGKSVLGNMRSFIFACNTLDETEDKSIGLASIGQTFVDLTNNYYWPLLDEVKPKLGKYEPMVEPSRAIAETLFKTNKTSVIVHRDIISRVQKAFEILEYVGFISKRESSRGMKSGGRGSRYALNLCMLFENVHGRRLTMDLFRSWMEAAEEPNELHIKGIALSNVRMPILPENAELEILGAPIETLKKSKTYPYGLTERMIETLRDGGYTTVKKLSEASEAELDKLHWVGVATVNRMKNVVSQAIWL